MGSLAAVLARVTSPDPGVVTRMLRAAPHRGSEFSTAKLGRVALGVSSGDEVCPGSLCVNNDLAVAFSGMLDNEEQLRTELESGGASTVLTTPAEVVARLFRLVGTKVPERLRGIYNVVVTDGNTLWAFGDHVGFRPLFFRAGPEGVFVATEAKQIVAGAGIPYEPDLEALGLVFYGKLDGTRTALRGVEKVPRHSLMTAALQDAIRHESYWHPEDILESRPVPDDELFERFDALMSQAVRRCLAGRDVVSLSGGLDSPAVAAYAAPAHVERFGQPLEALSYFFPDHPSVDESPYITAVAKGLGIKLHSYAPQCRASTDRLAEWMALLDGPIPVMALSENEEHLRVAKSLGFRNVLTGEMAEFLFDLNYDVLAYLVARRRLRAAVRYVRSMTSRGGGYGSLRNQVVRGVLPVWARALYRRLRGQPVARTLAAPEWLDRRMLFQIPLESAKDFWRRRQIAYLEGQALGLESNDYLQSSTGVMMRRPFADVDLWEFFLGLPAETKHPDGRSKVLVRRFLKGKLPEVILNRRDKTFFDEYIEARMDYDALRGWLCEPDGYRVPGVDYDRLRESLEKEELDLSGFMWAKDLACVHAFVSGAR